MKACISRYKRSNQSEFSALVCALSSRYLNSYHIAYFKLYPDADILIHDCPFMLEYDLMFGLDNKQRIYNSYNYETYLMRKCGMGEKPRYIDYVHTWNPVWLPDAIYACVYPRRREMHL